ncbi:BamA/TamA family outer membrane protein [Algibacter sp.]|uniref:translocation and assembly module lipoprotein TamL n=1 Tax=Algibacter sp. TaxID=1872428 RepID=UPI003C72AFE6
MKNQLSNIFIIILLASTLYSCNAVKRVPNNEHLLDKTSIIINEEKNNTEILNNLLYQRPNRRILGFPLRLHMYNLARPNIDSIFEAKIYNKPKKLAWKTKLLSKKQLDKDIQSRKGFNNWLKNTGEAPTIVDEERTKRSLKRLEDYYVNKGWFDVNANYDIENKDNKRASVTYNVKTGQAFLIDSITKTVKSPIVDSLYKKIQKNSLIKKGEQYNSNNIIQERDRISNELRNSGIYHFKQDYITFEMDTIGTNKNINIGITIQDRAIRTLDSLTRVPFKTYTISDVNIITDYTFENRNEPFQDSILYGGYKLYSYGKMRYRPKALTDAIFISPGKIFRDLDRTRTYRYLNELRTFKYPNIEITENPNNTLSDTIRLTPLKKFNFGFSADVSKSNIQTIGFSLNPSLQIRNIFKGAETLEISGITSIGASDDVKIKGDPFFDIIEYGADLKLTIPRIFSPFYTENIIPKYMSPSTRIGLATTSQTNIGLDKQTFSGNFSYNWYPNTKVTDRLDLFSVQYVNNLNPDNYFDVYSNAFSSLNEIAQDVNYIDSDATLSIPDETDAFLAYALTSNTPSEISSSQLSTINSINERKNRLTENNLILSSAFNFTQDNRKNLFDNNFSIFRFKLELAGNLLASTSKLLGLKKDSEGRYQLLNVAYSQYVKTEFEYTKHWDLGKKNVLATRAFFGIAIPYGNSNSIPFSKSFFAGGPNDNRAWSAYSLGPGSSETTNEFNEANLKIAISAEQRFNLFGDLNGALFVDAGNIWNVLDNVEVDGATLSGLDSLKDIAIGSGIGLRYDFSFFLFRFDVGFKTYDPSYQDKNRWFNDYNFANAVYNIGINYPF